MWKCGNFPIHILDQTKGEEQANRDKDKNWEEIEEINEYGVNKNDKYNDY